MKFVLSINTDKDVDVAGVARMKLRALDMAGALVSTSGSGPIFDHEGDIIGNWEVANERRSDTPGAADPGVSES